MSENGRIYCPICGRTVVAVNIKEVENGDDEGYLFVHDDIVHDDTDLEALHAGLQ